MAFPAVADPIYLCAKWLLVSPTRIYTCSTAPTQIGRTHPHSRIYRLTPNGVFSRRKKFDMDAASLIERKPLDHIDEFHVIVVAVIDRQSKKVMNTGFLDEFFQLGEDGQG